MRILICGGIEKIDLRGPNSLRFQFTITSQFSPWNVGNTSFLPYKALVFPATVI